MSDSREWPPLTPGALIISGVAQKQPHGVFGGFRGKQTRWFELKIGKDSAELVYFEHPKTASSQAKGFVYLDSASVKFTKMGKEIRISDASHNTGGGRGAAGERHEAHVVGDMLLEFQSVEVCEKWEAALQHSMSQLTPTASTKKGESYKNYGDKSPRNVHVSGDANRSTAPAAAPVKAAPAPDSHPEATRHIYDLLRKSALKARDANPEATRFVYNLVRASSHKAGSKKVKIHIVYYSTYGHIVKMAEEMASAITASGNEVAVFQVPETLHASVLEKMHAPPKASHPVVDHSNAEDVLCNCDGLLFGYGTRFGSMAAQMKTFIDGTGGLWMKGAIVGKPYGVFVSNGTQGGGQEAAIFGALANFTHHGMIFVPIGYSCLSLVTNMEEIHGSSPWGAGTFSNSDGSRQPSRIELDIAKHQATYFTAVAGALAKGRAA